MPTCGAGCLALLRAGQTRAVEELAMFEWHAPSYAPSTARQAIDATCTVGASEGA